MKVAIIGSRSLNIQNLEEYIPEGTDEIISVDTSDIGISAMKYAITNDIKFTEMRNEYDKYGRYAPLNRNDRIADYADIVVAFWDGRSVGTKYIIDYCEIKGKQVIVNLI